MKKFLCAALAALLACTAFVGCKREPEGEKIDPNRTQIYVALYNGGLGRDWLDAADEAFEAKYTQYQVIVDASKQQFDGQMVYDNYDSYRQDIFFLDYVSDELYRKFINSGKIANIGAAMTAPLTEFDETESVYDKITPFLKNYYKAEDSTEMYALPWYQASYQIIYDKLLFTEKTLYMSEYYGVDAVPQELWWTRGDATAEVAKSVGQDGVAGTYDDGLPVTRDDFFAMMDRMIQVGVTPFTWAGDLSFYYTSFLLNLFAQYEGYNDTVLNYTLSGTEDVLGEITLQTAYKLRGEQEGKKYALQFAYDVITGGSGMKYYSGDTFKTTQDNLAAQNEFLYSIENKDKSPVAMLVDGTWWEKESENIFSTMATRYDEKYAYGKREFGVMPLPIGNEQTWTNNTVACTSGRSMVYMNNNSGVKDGALLFLQFLHTDEMLSMATGLANTGRPYIYEMNSEDSARMTPYGRELQQYYADSQVVFDEIPLHDFFRTTAGVPYMGYMRMFASGSSFDPGKAFNSGKSTVDSWLVGMTVSEATWQDAIAASGLLG
ncbi:MAG: hypothetical protein DBX59_04815 [Bacillota bacterium]|nr:MAG: hypothetical protein DBX59_04815 [Bacillota bacterium]